MEETPAYSGLQEGRIITFYSYKGGVGRSMALANIAVLLAKNGKKVLVIDWDLEAPGLNRYFESKELSRPVTTGGLMHLLEDASDSTSMPNYQDYLVTTETDDFPAIHLLTSGDESSKYRKTISAFSWENFFQHKSGGKFLENLRSEWKRDYDFVLIDSRTGITDSGGVCTIQLPDILVFVVGPNYQNLNGYKKIVSSIHRERANLPYDRSRILILPILSRFDGREESDLAKMWLKRFALGFQSAFDDWLPKDYTPLDVMERTKLPHIARYSFGEELAVLNERESDPDQLPYYYAAITRILESNFQDINDVIGKREEKPAAKSVVDATDDALAAYKNAIEIVKANDLLGWRKLNQKYSAEFQRSIIVWQNLRRKNPPTKQEELPQMVLEGIACCAPVMAIALAGVESQKYPFTNQLGLIEEFLNPSGWERSGSTVLTQFPETIVFVYQALLGALAMQTHQSSIALHLANLEIKDVYANSALPLFLQPGMTGWPESLSHTCTIAWKFLLDLSDNWPWLLDVFGDSNSYKSALGSYYMFLHTVEFLDAIDKKIDVSNINTLRLTVPISFVSLTEQNQRKAVNYFKASVPTLAKLWRAKNLSSEAMNKKWSEWIKTGVDWIAGVYQNGFPWGSLSIPIRNLPEWIANSGD